MQISQPKRLSIIISWILLGLLFAACQGNSDLETTPNLITQATLIPSPTIENTATPTTEIIQPSKTPTLMPSPTATQGPLAWRIPVLEYHHPTYFAGEGVKMTVDWFNEQIDWLGDNQFKTLTGEELIRFIDGSYQPQQRSVVLRFDIGVPKYEEYANIVIPALRRNNFHAIIFLIVPSFTDDCEHPNDMICWDDLKQWETEGLITVASHGIDHPDYAEISRAYASQDAGNSKWQIEEKLGHSIDLFAYPFDSVPADPGGILEPLGYSGGFTGWPAYPDRSIVFGSQNYWEIASYYPYSGDDYYPEITTAGPYFGSTFPELILSAIEISETEIATLTGQAVDMDPTPSPEPGPSPTPSPTQIMNIVPTATTKAGEDPLLQYTLYCLNNIGKVLDVPYLQYIAFPADLSAEAQNILSSPVLVKPVCHFEKNNNPEAIVLHYTGSLANHEGSVSHFRSPDSGTSAHYLVERDGSIIQLVPESYVANHVSCYGNPAVNCLPDAPLVYDENGNYTRPATRSIGIEIVNAGPLVYRDQTPDILTDKYGTPFEGDPFVFEDFDPYGRYRYEFWEPYTEAQLDSLAILIEDIMTRWDFGLVVGHDDLQTNIDPGPALDEFMEEYQ